MRTLWFILISIIVCTAFLSLRLRKPSLNQQLNSDLPAVVEANSGPRTEVGSNLVGLSEVEPGKLLVASRDRGLFFYSKKPGWEIASAGGGSARVSSLQKVDQESIVSFEDGKLLIFSTHSSSPLESHLPRGYVYVKRCGSEIYGIAKRSVFKITQWKFEKELFATPSPLTSLSCSKDSELLLGTEGDGAFRCELSQSKCEKLLPSLPSNHVTAITRVKNKIFVGLYGDPDHSLMTYDDHQWKDVGGHFGDIVSFADGRSLYPLTITESGYVFSFNGSQYTRLKISELVTPPVIYSRDQKKLWACSYKALIQFDMNGTTKTFGSPVVLKASSPGPTIGNSFVWDILPISNDIVYSATSQAGVWWSSDGGRTWDSVNQGLSDSKVHFLALDSDANKLIAGTHSKGLFICNIPCKGWRLLPNQRLTDADLQAVVKSGISTFLIASEHGAITLDSKNEKVTGFVPLKSANMSVSDFWTLNKIDEDFLFGIYFKPNRLDGVWKFDGTSFSRLFALDSPITGIERHNKIYFIGTLRGLFSCSEKQCHQVGAFSINRMTADGDFLWLATSDGVARFSFSGEETRWLTHIPAQTVKILPGHEKIFLVGTTQEGVLRLRINE